VFNAADIGRPMASLAGLSCAALAGQLLAVAASAGGAPEGQPKLVIIQFGGGVRSSETIDDPGHRHIPRLWREMVPHGVLFTNMRVEGKVVHPNSTGSIVTGHWEWDDLDWSQPVQHPTIFEIYRKARGAPDTKAWAFVYASILSQVGASRAEGLGDEFAANVIEPPTIPRSAADEMGRLMATAAATGRRGAELEAAAQCAALARSSSRIARTGLRSDAARAFLDRQFEAWKAGTGTTSHDAFLADCALAAMRAFAPDVLLVAFGEIDSAHYGSWSRYTDAIERTDELTWRLWRATEELPSYRGRTFVLVLPDHGRELETSGGSGFVHHSDFYADANADEGCRRVWMLVEGPGMPREHRVDAAIPITAVAATGLEFLGLTASPGAAASVLRLLR
jgi:hypothetical protein